MGNEENYQYLDTIRHDVLSLVPDYGQVIGCVGCGQAKTEEQLVLRGREVHGVDVSSKAIEVAKNRITSARVIAENEMLPFAENSLDGLILTDVLEHIPLAKQRLASYARMVKKGGWIVISVPNMRHLNVLSKLVIQGDWPEYPMGIFDETHIQVMTHKRLRRWANDAGLSFKRYQDSYDYRFIQRNIYRLIDKLTFKIFKSFLQLEVVALFVRN